MDSVRVFGAVAIAILLFAAGGCDSDDPARPAYDTVFGGAWALRDVDTETGIRTYERMDLLSGDWVGYQFAPDGVLWIRDPGWCGTGPLVFSNYEGTWTEESESSYLLTYFAIDEVTTFRLEILECGDEEMRAVFSELE